MTNKRESIVAIRQKCQAGIERADQLIQGLEGDKTPQCRELMIKAKARREILEAVLESTRGSILT